MLTCLCPRCYHPCDFVIYVSAMGRVCRICADSTMIPYTPKPEYDLRRGREHWEQIREKRETARAEQARAENDKQSKLRKDFEKWMKRNRKIWTA